MTNPSACIRCHGTELVEVTFESPALARVAVDAGHSSPVLTRVCVSCGAVLFTAVAPGNLRVAGGPEREVQEYDF